MKTYVLLALAFFGLVSHAQAEPVAVTWGRTDWLITSKSEVSNGANRAYVNPQRSVTSPGWPGEIFVFGALASTASTVFDEPPFASEYATVEMSFFNFFVVPGSTGHIYQLDIFAHLSAEIAAGTLANSSIDGSVEVPFGSFGNLIEPITFAFPSTDACGFLGVPSLCDDVQYRAVNVPGGSIYEVQGTLLLTTTSRNFFGNARADVDSSHSTCVSIGPSGGCAISWPHGLFVGVQATLIPEPTGLLLSGTGLIAFMIGKSRLSRTTNRIRR